MVERKGELKVEYWNINKGRLKTYIHTQRKEEEGRQTDRQTEIHTQTDRDRHKDRHRQTGIDRQG